MTPDEFLMRNPRWREQASAVVRQCMTEFFETTQIPKPWPNDVLDMIEIESAKMALDVFERFRPEMGEDTFQELITLIDREVKQFALEARAMPNSKAALQ
jgi:hypothetical protein